MSLFLEDDSPWSGIDDPRIRIPKKLRETPPAEWPHTTEAWKLMRKLATAAAKRWTFAPVDHIGAFTVILGEAKTFEAHRDRALAFLGELRFVDDFEDPDLQYALIQWATAEIQYQDRLRQQRQKR